MSIEEPKQEYPVEKQELRFEEIEELREPMQKLLRDLHEHINLGEYSVIIGDDASGRIPARLFRETLKKIYEKQGLSAPETKFIAGTRGYEESMDAEKAQKVKEFIREKVRPTVLSREDGGDGGRVLVATETIGSGQSLKPVADALRAHDLLFDIAAIGYPGDIKGEGPDLVEKELGNIFLGMSGIPAIDASGWNSSDHATGRTLGGVEKTPTELHARRYDYDDPRSPVGKFAGEELKREARKDVFQLADELAEWYEENLAEVEEKPNS